MGSSITLSMKAAVSSVVLPTSSGMSCAYGGAAGVHVCCGMALPSTTGANCAPVNCRKQSCSAAVGTFCSFATSPGFRPKCAKTRSATPSPCSVASTSVEAPLCTMALWNRPLAPGMPSKVLTLAPPPDSPKMVTLPASPPKPAMLSRTHSSAAIRSSWPALPALAKRSSAPFATCA